MMAKSKRNGFGLGMKGPREDCSLSEFLSRASQSGNYGGAGA